MKIKKLKQANIGRQKAKKSTLDTEGLKKKTVFAVHKHSVTLTPQKTLPSLSLCIGTAFYFVVVWFVQVKKRSEATLNQMKEGKKQRQNSLKWASSLPH